MKPFMVFQLVEGEMYMSLQAAARSDEAYAAAIDAGEINGELEAWVFEPITPRARLLEEFRSGRGGTTEFERVQELNRKGKDTGAQRAERGAR